MEKPKNGLKIAIIGSAPHSRGLAPYDDPTWEIWGCSADNWQNLPRSDAWFELHSLVRKAGEAPDYVRFLAQHPRVYLAVPNKLIPGGIEYPREEMEEKYGSDRLSSSASFMMALAIKQKPAVIGIYGLDMTTTVEYALQRCGFRMMIEEALKEGIQVTAPPQCDILEPPPLYAFKEQWASFWKHKARLDGFRKRISEIDSMLKPLDDERKYLEGAEHATTYEMRMWLKP